MGTAASIYLIALEENWLTGSLHSLHSTHFSPFHILEKYLRHFSPFHILTQAESNKIQSLVLAWKRTDEDPKRSPNSFKERLSLSSVFNRTESDQKSLIDLLTIRPNTIDEWNIFNGHYHVLRCICDIVILGGASVTLSCCEMHLWRSQRTRVGFPSKCKLGNKAVIGYTSTVAQKINQMRINVNENYCKCK